MWVRGAASVILLTAFMTAAWLGGQVQPSFAQTGPSLAPGTLTDVQQAAFGAIAESPFTTGLVAGTAQCTEFAVANDIANTLAAGQESGPHGEVALRVVPIAGNGGTRNITDVLTLSGADMTIAPVMLADRLRKTKTFGDISDRLVYITPLYVEEFHLLARPEIKTVTDLAGKTVNLGEQGSIGALLGREVLGGLGIDDFGERYLGLDAALDAMRAGEISAMLLVSGKPIDAMARDTRAGGLHLLTIPYSPALQHDYLPSSLSHEDYPNLIGAGQTVDTIGIKSALFVRNWPTRSARFRLMDLFVQTLFSRLPEFLGGAHHPKWREVNLAETLPEWQRFGPAQRWLDRQPDGSLRNAFGHFLDRKSIGNPPERDELFQEFLRWRKRMQGQ